MLTRRDLVGLASFLAAFGSVRFSNTAEAGLEKPEETTRFTFDTLVSIAEKMALKPYVRPVAVDDHLLSKIDYEALGQIRFDTSRALFAKGPGQYPITFFHLGRFFRTPVKMHVIREGVVQEIIYDKTLFDMPADSPAKALAPNTGFAGFRFQESRLGDQKKLDWKRNDWLAFLGASYFRAIGEQYQYGIPLAA